MLHTPVLWYFDILIPPCFVWKQYLWNVALQPPVGCCNVWAGCSPLGEKHCETGLWHRLDIDLLQKCRIRLLFECHLLYHQAATIDFSSNHRLFHSCRFCKAFMSLGMSGFLDVKGYKSCINGSCPIMKNHPTSQERDWKVPYTKVVSYMNVLFSISMS